MYVANALNALVAVPFYVASTFLISAKWCGRKGVVVTGAIAAGLCLILSTLIKQTVPSMIIYYVASGLLWGVFCVIYIYAVELFPTIIRSRSMAVQSVCARVGAV